MSDPVKAYGEGRTRKNVSYADVERAAIAILKAERRPTVETIRKALGSGSPDTLGDALRRFWRDLGARMEGDPAALTRMPSEIAELADGLWQRALKLASEAATQDDNAAQQRLAQRQSENDLKQRSFKLREQEMDTLARARERALAEARDQLLSLTKALAAAQATNQVDERRIARLEIEVAQYRQQIGALIAAAVAPKKPRPPQRTPTAAKSNPAVRRRMKTPTRKVVKSKPRKGAMTARPARRSPDSARKAPGRRSR